MESFIPTHVITVTNANGSVSTEPVLLLDGVAYTQQEWEGQTSADWEVSEEGEWLFQGRATPENGDTVEVRRVVDLPWEYVCFADLDGTEVLLPVNTPEEERVARAWLDGADRTEARIWALPSAPELGELVACCEGGAGDAFLAEQVDCSDAVKTNRLLTVY